MSTKIQSPNYHITPPQANDLGKVSKIIEILDLEQHQSDVKELLQVWNEVTKLNKDLSDEKEKTSCKRDLDYYINAGKWLSLIEPIPKNDQEPKPSFLVIFLTKKLNTAQLFFCWRPAYKNG